MSVYRAYTARQHGATLIITMIFMVLLTFLGVSTIQDTLLEEKMASNLRQSNLVFQAAEDALRRGEQKLDGTPVLADFDNSGGYYADDYDVDTFIQSADVSSCVGMVDDAGDPDDGCRDFGQGIKAGFVLQRMAAVGTGDSIETGAVQDKQEFYRVTAKAQSANTSAVTILQTIFRR